MCKTNTIHCTSKGGDKMTIYSLSLHGKDRREGKQTFPVWIIRELEDGHQLGLGQKIHAQKIMRSFFPRTCTVFLCTNCAWVGNMIIRSNWENAIGGPEIARFSLYKRAKNNKNSDFHVFLRLSVGTFCNFPYF